MSKMIKYIFLSCEVNHGTEENPDIKQVFLEKSMIYSKDNEEIAKIEAYNGEYEIYDDGIEPVPTESEDIASMIVDHEYRLTLLELGITE